MGSPWEKTVNVYLDSISPLRYRIEPAGPKKLPKNGKGDLVFDNDGHDGFNIQFVFTDTTGNNYTFPKNKDADKAVSSQLGATDLCPPQGTSEVFTSPSTSGPNWNTLTVYNENPCPAQGDFSYVLWVTNDQGANYLPLDPGGVNNNGSTRIGLGGGGSVSATAIAVTVIVAAVAGFALYKAGVFSH